MLLFIGLLTYFGVGSVCSKDPVECRRSSLGFDYTGHANLTASGLTCQAWSSQSPHPHNYTDARRFPDDTLADAGNYCRNPPPDSKLEGPWCYTTNPGVPWELCPEIPWCSEFPECRLTDAGTEYKGHISTTVTGATCIDWSIASPASRHEPRLAADDANYCRNPDSKPAGPWCYTDIGIWDYCTVPFCKPSAYCRRSQIGQEYVGTVSNTGNGVPCQRWDSQYPHPHGFTDPAAFPDATLSDAGSMCRNPDRRSTGPWCHTQNVNIVEESCDLPFCPECKISDNGAEYAGNKAVTSSGKACLSWANLASSGAQPLKDANRFPDASLAYASNYCRNPDRKTQGPWCYHAEDIWETCDIPKCSGSDRDTFKPRLANHILHIGIDGFDPCFINCSSGAPNIIQRVGGLGTSTIYRGRTVLQTVSAPSWTAILCGIPVESSGVTGNSWKATWLNFPADITPSVGATVPFPCLWHEIKAQDRTIRTASFTNWDWFWYITSMGMPNALDFDYYCPDYTTCDPELVNRAVDYLNQTFISAETSYTFVYIGNVDGTGHEHGWCEEEYLAEVDKADGYVGQLLDVVDASGLADRITVMISTDHAGHGRVHGAMLDTDIIIPSFVRGPGINVDVEFRHEVTNNDYAPTAMESLGLRQSKWWKGDVMWEAFNP